MKDVRELAGFLCPKPRSNVFGNIGGNFERTTEPRVVC